MSVRVACLGDEDLIPKSNPTWLASGCWLLAVTQQGLKAGASVPLLVGLSTRMAWASSLHGGGSQAQEQTLSPIMTQLQKSQCVTP